MPDARTLGAHQTGRRAKTNSSVPVMEAATTAKALILKAPLRARWIGPKSNSTLRAKWSSTRAFSMNGPKDRNPTLTTLEPTSLYDIQRKLIRKGMFGLLSESTNLLVVAESWLGAGLRGSSFSPSGAGFSILEPATEEQHSSSEQFRLLRTVRSLAGLISHESASARDSSGQLALGSESHPGSRLFGQVR
jgi:hypothetical protein